MNGSKTVADKLDSDVLATDKHGTNEATLLVGAVKADLDVALHEARSEAVSLGAKWLGLFAGTAGGAGSLDTGEDEGDLGVLLGHDDLEAVAAGDKVDNSGVLAGTLPRGKVLGGAAGALGSVDNTGGDNLLGRVDAAGLSSGGLLGDNELVKLGRTLLVVTAVAESAGKTLLDELLGNVLALATVGNGHTLALLVLAVLGLDIVDQDVHNLANQTLTKELLGLGSPVRVLGVRATRATDRGKLDTALLVVTLGDNAQLVGTPNANDSGVKGLALGGGRSNGTGVSAGTVGGLASLAKALPECDALGLGSLLSRTEAVKAAVRSEDTGVPVNDLGKTSCCEELGNVTVGVDGLADDEAGAGRGGRKRAIGVGAREWRCTERDRGREEADLDLALEETNLGEELGLLTPSLSTLGDTVAHGRSTGALGTGNDKGDELVVGVVEEKTDTKLGAIADLLDNGWLLACNYTATLTIKLLALVLGNERVGVRRHLERNGALLLGQRSLPWRATHSLRLGRPDAATLRLSLGRSVLEGLRGVVAGLGPAVGDNQSSDILGRLSGGRGSRDNVGKLATAGDSVGDGEADLLAH